MTRPVIGVGLMAMLLLVLGVLAHAVVEARRDPVVRRVSVALADWPVGARLVRVALLSDVHLGSRRWMRTG